MVIIALVILGILIYLTIGAIFVLGIISLMGVAEKKPFWARYADLFIGLLFIGISAITSHLAYKCLSVLWLSVN